MYEAERLYIELTDAIRDNGGVRCQELPDAFFIDFKDTQAPEKMKNSKALCATCPIQLLCLEYALEAGEQDGIWGGLTRNERKALKRSRVIRERVY